NSKVVQGRYNGLANRCYRICKLAARFCALDLELSTASNNLGNLASRSSHRNVFMSAVPLRLVATRPDSRSTRKWCDNDDVGRSISNSPQAQAPRLCNSRTMSNLTSSLKA